MIKLLMLISLMYSGSEFARVGDLRGDAKIWRYGEEGSEWLTINNIIGEGDELLTDDDSYLEIEFSDGSVLTLGNNTSVYFDRIEDDRTYFTLNKGAARVYARERVFGVFASDHAVYVEEGSIVRVESDSDYFLARVYKGRAEVDKQKIYAGSEVIIDRGRYYSGRIGSYDRLDRWAEERERNYYVITRVEYVPVRCYIGIYHLHRHGRWVFIRPYGWVWVPRVPRSWRPYCYGYWVYRPGLGWVWVSYEPWGWIPYRYGSWTYVVGYGWVWIPGETFAGAWVEWYYGPDWVGWAPIDYYGNPIIVVNNITVVNIVSKEDFHKPIYRYKPPKSGVYKEVYKPYKGVDVKEVVRYKATELEKPIYFKKVDVVKEEEKPIIHGKDELIKVKTVEKDLGENKGGQLYPERPVVEKKADVRIEKEARVEEELKPGERKVEKPLMKEKILEKESGTNITPEKPVVRVEEKESKPEIYPERPSYRDYKSKLLEKEDYERQRGETPTRRESSVEEDRRTEVRPYTPPAIERKTFKEEGSDGKGWDRYKEAERVKVEDKAKGRAIPEVKALSPSDNIPQNKPELKKRVEKKAEEDDNHKNVKGEDEK